MKYKTLLPLYIKGLCSGKYTLQEAADSTGYSVNWLWSLKKKYQSGERFDDFFEHKNKGRVPANKTPEALRQKIAAIYVADFLDVNFAYFKKCLESMHGIKISIPTLTAILKDYGQRSPEARKAKKKGKVHRPRLRRECEGDMIQIDGTPFAWFNRFGDNKKYCLTGSIDDATGKITGLYMTDFECLYGYLEIMRQTCQNFGVPREVYSDRAAIFCTTPNKNKGLDKWETLAVLHGKNTQWQRVLDELHVRQILAWSPEAKGRVERMWLTIQGQLPVWLKLRGIKTVEQANARLSEYIKEFNASYAVEPARPDLFWLPPPANLSHILQARISRHTDRSGAFSFHAYKFALDSPAPYYRAFELCISEKGIRAYLDGCYYPVRCLESEFLSGLGETMPQVLQDLIYRYLFAFAKEISA